MAQTKKRPRKLLSEPRGKDRVSGKLWITPSLIKRRFEKNGENMKNGWMIRAGNGGRYFDEFNDNDCVAIGWNSLGDLRNYTSPEALKEAYIQHFGNAKPGRTANALAMIRKFRDDIKQGDTLITYSQEHREYLVGEDLGQYEFRPEPEQVGEFQHIRKVKWLGRVSRDQFSQATRNSLGSVLTVFSLSDTVISEVQDRLAGKPVVQPTTADETQTAEAEFEVLREEVVSRGHELIKDKIQGLDPEEMEELTAALLRAMGSRPGFQPGGQTAV